MDKLGIDTTMIIVQIVNFTVLFFILKKYLAKPILAAIKQRESELEKVEESKEELEVTKQKALDEHKKILSDAQKQADEILGSARSSAEQEKREIVEAANVQAKKIVSKAKLQKKVKK